MPRRQINLRARVASDIYGVPAVAPAGEGVLYYDSAAAALKLSLAGGAFVTMPATGAAGDTLVLGGDVTLSRAGADRLAISEYVEITAPAAAQASFQVTSASGDVEILATAPATNRAAQLTMNSFDGQCVLRWRQNAVTVWQQYMNGGDATHLYLRDMTNGRMHVEYTLGTAGNALTNVVDRFSIGGGTPISGYLSGTTTFDPASLADGAGATTTVTVTGAALGDIAIASFSLDLQGITVTAWVSATNTVSVRFQNESGGTLDLASGTLRASVIKH